jgi:hypothetical protein
MSEENATITGYFVWHLEPESVNISFGSILAPDVPAMNSKLNTLEN